MELGICGGEINQVIGVGKDGAQLGTLFVFAECAHFLWRDRSREPLHVVLDENLHGRAANRAGSLDGHVHSATDRHVRAEERFFRGVADRGLTALNASSRCPARPNANRSDRSHLKSRRRLEMFRPPRRVVKTALGPVLEKLVKRGENDTSAARVDANIKIDLVFEKM